MGEVHEVLNPKYNYNRSKKYLGSKKYLRTTPKFVIYLGLTKLERSIAHREYLIYAKKEKKRKNENPKDELVSIVYCYYYFNYVFDWGIQQG
jgi:hypothetical protein